MIRPGFLCIEVQEVENGFVIQEVDHTTPQHLVRSSKVWVAGEAKGLGELIQHLAEEAKKSREVPKP